MVPGSPSQSGGGGVTSLPLPLRGKNGGRPAGNGKKEGIGQIEFFFIILCMQMEARDTDTKTRFQR